MLNVKFSGDFAKRLQSRVEKWGTVEPMQFTVQVPPEVSWWYFQEFGTADRWTQAPDKVLHASVAVNAPPHQGAGNKIKPLNTKLLRFEIGGNLIFAHEVHGVNPSRSVTKVISTIEEEISAEVRKAFEQGAADNPELLRTAMQQAAEKAIVQIAASMERNISPAASAEFEGAAKVV